MKVMKRMKDMNMNQSTCQAIGVGQAQRVSHGLEMGTGR